MSKLTPHDLEEIFDICQIPGSQNELEVLACWIEGILISKGEKYIKRNRRRLLRDWVNILKYGLSKI